MSMTAANVSFLKTFLKATCVSESTKPYPADALIVHIKPITYFPLETLEESEEGSVSKTRRMEDIYLDDLKSKQHEDRNANEASNASSLQEHYYTICSFLRDGNNTTFNPHRAVKPCLNTEIDLGHKLKFASNF
ncbi:hypothetical protein CFP56_024130 [Quercus suber]|uniref:Uncharacterized protein n=1 Tax=Quercus suber TaxID=58331 RepID=A0AAW0K730_QUESU